MLRCTQRGKEPTYLRKSFCTNNFDSIHIRIFFSSQFLSNFTIFNFFYHNNPLGPQFCLQIKTIFFFFLQNNRFICWLLCTASNFTNKQKFKFLSIFTINSIAGTQITVYLLNECNQNNKLH